MCLVYSSRDIKLCLAYHMQIKSTTRRTLGEVAVKIHILPSLKKYIYRHAKINSAGQHQLPVTSVHPFKSQV